MQAELANQEFSGEERKPKRVRIKKKGSSKHDYKRKLARKKRREVAIIVFLVLMVLAFIVALLMMKYGS